MDVRQLEAVVAVAETGSVTKAAQLLHLVQPAVTRQVQALEQELGVALFVRTSKGMRATVAGETMVGRARRALTELDRAWSELKPRPDHCTGIVTVGLLESVLDMVGEPLAAAVVGRHPGIELQLLTAYSGHLQRWLDDGDVDMALLYDVRTISSLKARPLLREKLWAVGPADAGLRVGDPIGLETFAKQPAVLPVTGHGLRTIIDHAFARGNVRFEVAIGTNSLRLQKQLVVAGYGWTILPAAGVAEDVRNGMLSAAPFCEPEMSRSLVLGLPHPGRIPPALDAVARELTSVIISSAHSGAWPSIALID